MLTRQVCEGSQRVNVQLTLGRTGTSGYKDFKGASVNPTSSLCCCFDKGGATTAAARTADRNYHISAGATSEVLILLKSFLGPVAYSQQCSWSKAKKYLASMRAVAAVANLASAIVLHDAHIDCVYWANLPPEAAGLWPCCFSALDDNSDYTPAAERQKRITLSTLI